MRGGATGLVLALLFGSATAASANGRAALSNRVFFRPGDPHAVYVGTTFGLLVSPDACQFYWLCEQDLGYGGEFDPNYAVTGAGTIVLTTFQGLRVSHDGGCSFTTALENHYMSGLAVGPSGEIWAGTSNTGSGNAVYTSGDDGQTFDPRTGLPGAMWFQSISVAPSDASRVYVGAYLISGAATPPTSHWFRTDDAGMNWSELALGGVAFASSPALEIAAIDPQMEDTVYVISRGANPPSGDRLYRSRDAGTSLTELLVTTSSIAGVVLRDPHHLDVATASTGLLESTDGGATFTPLPSPLKFGCLGQRADGRLFACGTAYDPDHMALASSLDGRSWQPALRFEYITGPLDCPSGTVEEDVCSNLLWRSFSIQLGQQDSSCAAGPDAGGGELPRDVVTPTSHGCCDAAPGSQPAFLAGVVVIALRRRRGRR